MTMRQSKFAWELKSSTKKADIGAKYDLSFIAPCFLLKT